MAKVWDEKLNNLSDKLADLSKKAADAAGDAKAYRELLQEVIDEKISTVKGNVVAMQENARLAGEEQQGKIRSEILKIRMTAKAKAEDLKDAQSDPAAKGAGTGSPSTFSFFSDGAGISCKRPPRY